MTKQEANRLAAGYAWGREDAAHVKTVTADDWMNGDYLFALAYAEAQDRYNNGLAGSMPSVGGAYDTWQRTGGRTIDFLKEVTT